MNRAYTEATVYEAMRLVRRQIDPVKGEPLDRWIELADVGSKRRDGIAHKADTGLFDPRQMAEAAMQRLVSELHAEPIGSDVPRRYRPVPNQGRTDGHWMEEGG